jgi:hypothetical protein
MNSRNPHRYSCSVITYLPWAKKMNRAQGVLYLCVFFKIIKWLFFLLVPCVMVLGGRFVVGTVIKPGPAWQVEPGPSWPGGWTGSGLLKDRLMQQPGKTRSTRRVNPWPGRPSQTRTRPGVYFFLSNVVSV